MLRHVAELKKRQVRQGLALFLCLLAGGCSGDAVPARALAEGAEACSVAPEGLQRRRVEAVVDGDTLRLAGGESLRLVGVNTSEKGRDGRADEPQAEEARRALAELVEPVGAVWLQAAEQPRDRYQRTLAYAFDEHGNSLSAQLIRRGLGFHVAISPNVRYSECLQAQEQLARGEALGVWSEAQLRPRSIDQLAPREGGFRILVDRVTRVSFKDNGWWVQLGGKVGLKIAAPDQHLYSRKQLRRLEGKQVEARGWLVPMKGDWWMMTIGHPSMLQRQGN